MSACLLDTNAAIDLMRGRLVAATAVSPFQELLLPFTVLGELISGARRARNPAAEMVRLETWREDYEVIPGDEETAYLYGELLSDLERQGRRIPTNDLWIAAVAVQFDLPLLARDEHFRRLPRLRWVGY